MDTSYSAFVLCAYIGCIVGRVTLTLACAGTQGPKGEGWEDLLGIVLDAIAQRGALLLEIPVMGGMFTDCLLMMKGHPAAAKAANTFVTSAASHLAGTKAGNRWVLGSARRYMIHD
eukprot:855557-Pyramimonas_sp.AAC.2